jgi:hypothetical protein
LRRPQDVLAVVLSGRQLVLEALLPQVLLVGVVLVAQAGVGTGKAVGQRLLAGVLRLLHGRAAKCATLGELRGQLDACRLQVRLRDVVVRVADQIIEVLVLPGIGVLGRRDVLRAAQEALQCGLLSGIAPSPKLRIRKRLILALRQVGIELAVVRLVGLRVDRVDLSNQPLIVVNQPLR